MMCEITKKVGVLFLVWRESTQETMGMTGNCFESVQDIKTQLNSTNRQGKQALTFLA